VIPNAIRPKNKLLEGLRTCSSQPCQERNSAPCRPVEMLSVLVDQGNDGVASPPDGTLNEALPNRISELLLDSAPMTRQGSKRTSAQSYIITHMLATYSEIGLDTTTGT
jgi:hypothetical protein